MMVLQERSLIAFAHVPPISANSSLNFCLPRFDLPKLLVNQVHPRNLPSLPQNVSDFQRNRNAIEVRDHSRRRAQWPAAAEHAHAVNVTTRSTHQLAISPSFLPDGFPIFHPLGIEFDLNRIRGKIIKIDLNLIEVLLPDGLHLYLSESQFSHFFKLCCQSTSRLPIAPLFALRNR